MKNARNFILPALAVILCIYMCEKEKGSTDLPYGKLARISELQGI